MNLDTDPNKDFDGSVPAPAAPDASSAPAVPASAVVPPTQKAAATLVPRKELAASQRGLLVGATLEEQFRIARAYASSGLMPSALNTPEKVLVALQLCHELGLPPMTSIGRIMVINGTPSIFGDLPLALVRRSGLLEGFQEEEIRDEKGALIGARCAVKRKGELGGVVRAFTVEDAKLAKLWGKTGRDNKPTPWVLYPGRMLQMRARSWALKDLFADVLMGVSIAEYDFNATVENGTVIGGDDPAASENTAAAAYRKAYLDEEKPEAQAAGSAS